MRNETAPDIGPRVKSGSRYGLFEWFLSAFPDVVIPEDVRDACRFLEACGLVFAVDFGYQNAHERAGELIVYGNTDIPRAYRTGEDLP